MGLAIVRIAKETLPGVVQASGVRAPVGSAHSDRTHRVGGFTLGVSILGCLGAEMWVLAGLVVAAFLAPPTVATPDGSALGR